ncbi:hypothetical protein ABVK25_010922 [Lepraria finkii]|uniref:Zn(2)-C6 fungal-type domain-containing protein n=1 Tax=Lepraria finkii TaxID=1340010 RepID=A0ABR4AV84_9LECA
MSNTHLHVPEFSGDGAAERPIRVSKSPKVAPRLGHKKSRTGCQQCRARRIKCNEVHPICGSCKRYQVPCIYDRRSPSKAAGSRQPDKTRDSSIRSSPKYDIKASSATVRDFPESRERRLLELRLLHHYATRTSMSFSASPEPAAKEIWSVVCPKVALKHDALLYSIYAISALHMTRTEPFDPDIMDAHQKYFELGLQEHNRDIDNLSKDNADATCLTTNLIRVIAFAVLHERPLYPYTPPTQWVQMTRGASDVHRAAWKWIEDDETSISVRLISRLPILTKPETLYTESSRQDLLHLLRRSQTDTKNEFWSSDIQETYASTISVIGSVLIAISAHESRADIFRRLILFPMLIPKPFIDLVMEDRPRALVILAHFFALLAKFNDMWWTGDTGEREIRGIRTVLSDEWLELMNWSLRDMEGKIALLE